ncbi:hypothetical protein BWI15_35170 [Kribbella sp. ALI-6-A]|uniref:hypothetical protein n=1 Tax=Kribbella sp. ALI-6-A TaxID=1933817 RepID=UPI00097C75DA|nr:hypothetical protein [Kribbella sp. ALI-6-A]ONI68262.1 hypothetical protein BWI15_35170 [Kribbella sp. ALI-6-A]
MMARKSCGSSQIQRWRQLVDKVDDQCAPFVSDLECRISGEHRADRAVKIGENGWASAQDGGQRFGGHGS